nr:MAG: major capsid protein [Microvirus sp.]
MKSQQTNHFNGIPKANIQRSSFDRSHTHKTAFDAPWLTPIYVDEALPGDTFNLKMTAFARLATPIKPIMDNLYMETFFFSVPVRQIWGNWPKFNGEQVDPSDSTDFTVPQITIPINTPYGGLSDFFGIPPDRGFVTTVNALHFRAYNHIYNNWFRDQNLIDSAVVDTDDGPDNLSDYVLRRRRKRPDYFTSALPWPQKGEDVTVSLGSTAPIAMDNITNGGAGDITALAQSDGNAYSLDSSGTDLGISTADASGIALYADLSEAVGISINDLRQSFQIQKLLERDARGGTRYPEILKSHFGVVDPQMLVLQRPEFLGGGSSMVNINPVQQTAQTVSGTDASPQGNLAGFGTVSLHGHGFTKSFTEHCVLIGLVNVRADLTYQTSLDRMWSRSTRYDYYWPALAAIGEQEIKRKELWYTGSLSGVDDVIFGYQERYGEYRYKPSLITNQLRSEYSASLDIWHLSQQFTAAPTLSQTFIEEDPPIDRVIAVPAEPHFIFDSFIKLTCARPMPTYGTPGLIDHF